jgi:membrane-associated phospholipid phosphatase
MTNNNVNRYPLLTLSLGTALAVLAGIRFLDEKIAVAVMRLLHSNPLLHSVTADIPDLLLLLVCAGTAIIWLLYFYLLRNNGSEEKLCFLQLIGTVVPASYLLKMFLQFAFGRTNTRLWLAGGMPLQFDWFHGAGIGCFPSGHMTVFAAFGAAVWYVYPRYFRLIALFLVLLGSALIVTDYHFLSDVIAGAYVGIMLSCGIRHWLNMCGVRRWESQ